MQDFFSSFALFKIMVKIYFQRHEEDQGQITRLDCSHRKKYL